MGDHLDLLIADMLMAYWDSVGFGMGRGEQSYSKLVACWQKSVHFIIAWVVFC